MKLWQHKQTTDERILAFTRGKDPVFDPQLASCDVIGSMAHAIMLEKVGLITREEGIRIIGGLAAIYQETLKEGFRLQAGVEDIHSQVEMMLTKTLGDLGKKIHTGRSRNDQVMVDMKLFLRDELQRLIQAVFELGRELAGKAREHQEVLMPGYTHMQVAMPSSFGLWFGAYAEALAEDLLYMEGIYKVVNLNPLGSAAGYGSSFPVDREITTRLLGFDSLHVSSVNAQMSRGKTEWYMATAMGAVGYTLSRFAMDAILFMGQNFNFLSLPPELTTGSSIMPHKKNPDVLELVRAKCNRMIRLNGEISGVTGNLTSGYHRDFQILKEILIPAIRDLNECLDMMNLVVERIEVNPRIMEEGIYEYIYSVEEVNRKVQEGTPFRDAYREVADEIEKGRYRPARDHAYTHLGSIGNPGISEIETKLEEAMGRFRFVTASEIANRLITHFEES